MLDKLDKKKGTPHMVILTLSKSGNPIYLSRGHIIGCQASDDPNKVGVTVVYTTFQAYPFEVKEDCHYIMNLLNDSYGAVKK
jgi:hypothetical protein